jgi:hypothetical protein
MKLSNRDKLLAMLLPTLIILLGYGLFFLRGKVTERNRLEKALADASAKAPKEAQFVQQYMEFARVKKETHAIQEQVQALQKKWHYETTFCAGGSVRHDRVEKFTNLLNKHHLTSLEDAAVESGGKDARMSPALESMMKKIAQLSREQKPQMRRIRFHGRYAEVQQALDELATGEVLAIPVGLTMKTTSDPSRREWTLLVWL